MTLAPPLIHTPPVQTSRTPAPFDRLAQSSHVSAQTASSFLEPDAHHSRGLDATPRSPDDYARFRPAYHVQPHVGWINDPCAPAYDPTTGLYHLFYQWNPKSSEWADISWGQVVSRDLVHWFSPVSGKSEPVLTPNAFYDREGVFSGCMWPRGPRGENGVLSIIYTSVSALPIHYSKPYHRGSETVSIATSRDAGRTWSRIPNNPILSGPPNRLSVKGWRDPFVARWPALSELLGSPPNSLYGLISGSLLPHRPTTFLYSIPPTDLTDWKFLSQLIHLPTSLLPTPWTGDMGKNWEVCNFLPCLRSERDNNRAWMIAGSEGGKRWGLDEQGSESGRTPRWSLWIAGTLEKDESTSAPRLEYSYSGVLDHGMYYAANSFHDPVKDRCIVWGWLLEDDLTPAQRRAQAWAGVLSLPRQLTILRIPHVVSALRTPLSEIGCICLIPEEGRNSCTVETLGIAPLEELDRLRQRARYMGWDKIALGHERSKVELPAPGKFWDFEAVVPLDDATCGEVGLIMRHTSDMSQHTTLTFSLFLETLSITGTSAEPLSGPHTLFAYASGQREPLRLRVLCDNSVIEVFANDRFAMSVRCYPQESDVTEAGGLTIFAKGTEREGLTVFEQVRLWSALAL